MSAAGKKLLRSVRSLRAAIDAGQELHVHVPPEFDVKALRRQLGMSQAQFAARFGFGLDAVKSWEQGRRRPDGAVRAFLKVIEHAPETVERVLAA